MRLKQTPEDFKVTEIAKAPKKDITGKYTYFWLEKTNYTTVRALKAIARALKISKRRLHFSGTKDKYAVTKQLVSIMHLEPEKLAQLNLKDIKIAPLHRGSKRITLGYHQANKFEIVVRDLPTNFDQKPSKNPPQNAKSDALANAAKPRVSGENPWRRAEELAKNGFPNYFDEQRFSHNNSDVGKALLTGDIRKAVELILSKDDESEKLAKEKKFKELVNYYDKPHSSERTIASWLITKPNDYAGAFRNLHKKIRMLYIHSYQSALFNRALSETIKKPIASLTINNTKLNIGAGAEDKELILPGFNSKLGASKYDKKLKALLKKDCIKLEYFKLPRTPELASAGGTHSAIVKPVKLKINKPTKDELNPEKKKVKVTFELPKGAYATLLVKILFS